MKTKGGGEMDANKPAMTYGEFAKTFFAYETGAGRWLDKPAINGERVQCQLCSEEDLALTMKHGANWGVKMDIGGIKFEICTDHLVYLFTGDIPYPG